MPTGMFEYRSEGERRAIEQAIAFVAEMHDLARTAPDGQVLGWCEGQAVERGRELLRATSRKPRRRGVEVAEEKRHGGGTRVRGRLRLKRRCGREVRTAIGPVRPDPMAWPL